MGTYATIIVKVSKGETIVPSIDNIGLPVYAVGYDCDSEPLAELPTVNDLTCPTEYAGIYVMSDGYVNNGVGETLLKYFNTHEMAKQLIALGDCVELSDRIVPRITSKCPDTVTESRPIFADSAGDLLNCEYLYYFDGNEWLIRDSNNEGDDEEWMHLNSFFTKNYKYISRFKPSIMTLDELLTDPNDTYTVVVDKVKYRIAHSPIDNGFLAFSEEGNHIIRIPSRFKCDKLESFIRNELEK